MAFLGSERELDAVVGYIQRHDIRSPQNNVIVEGRIADEPTYFHTFVAWFDTTPYIRIIRLGDDVPAISNRQARTAALRVQVREAMIESQRQYIDDHGIIAHDSLRAASADLASESGVIAVLGFGDAASDDQPKIVFFSPLPVLAHVALAEMQQIIQDTP